MALKKVDVTTPRPDGNFGEPPKVAWEKMNENSDEIEQRLTVVEQADPIRSYGDMRAYAGKANSLVLSADGIAGTFRYDPADAATPDDGGTVFVVTSGPRIGARYKRVFSGAVNILWWQADATGGADATSAWNSAVAHPAKNVFLPVGRFRIPTAELPSNVVVSGVKPAFDRTAKAFIGGSVLVGRLYPIAQCTAAYVARLGIDGGTSGGNGLEVSRTGFYNLTFEDLEIRASNHGGLIEQNGSDPFGGIVGGSNVTLLRCNFYGGPNGLAIKAPYVRAVLCNVYDTTIQGYVAVSDNINGAAIYSRAYQVDFIDCGGDGNQITLRVYTRDTRSLNNANNVQAADNIRWNGGVISGSSQHGVHIGDFSAQSTGGPVGQQTLIKNTNIFVTGARIDRNGFNAILVTRANGVDVDRNMFGENGTANASYTSKNIDYDVAGNVNDIRIGTGNIYSGAALGKEQGLFTWPANAGTVTLFVGAKLYKTAGTQLTYIGNVQGARPGEVITIQIAEDFTILNFAKAWDGRTITHRGAGKIVRAMWDSLTSSWIDLGETKTQASYEAVVGFAQNLALNYSANGNTSQFVTVTNNILGVSAVAPPSSLPDPQTRYTLRMFTTASKSIAGWDAIFVFPDGAPVAMTANKTRYCEFFWDGNKLVCTKTFEY